MFRIGFMREVMYCGRSSFMAASALGACCLLPSVDISNKLER